MFEHISSSSPSAPLMAGAVLMKSSSVGNFKSRSEGLGESQRSFLGRKNPSNRLPAPGEEHESVVATAGVMSFKSNPSSIPTAAGVTLFESNPSSSIPVGSNVVNNPSEADESEDNSTFVEYQS